MHSLLAQNSILDSCYRSAKIVFCVFLMVFVGLFNISTLANNQGTTITELVISASNLAPLNFTVNPGNIFVGEELIFTLGPARTSSNVVLNNIPCEIWIRPANSTNYVVFTGITNNFGICTYNTSQTLTQQNLILLTQPLTPDFPRPTGTQSQNLGSPINSQVVGGNTNVTSINGNIGAGSGFGLVIYQGNAILSNTVNYAVSGALADIDADYPTDNTGGGNNSGNGSGNNNRSNNNGSNNSGGSNNGNIFSFLPRTGGFAASIGAIVVVIILIIYLASRRKTIEEQQNQSRNS